jgi:Carboxypeptidase regulatory-like domain
LLTKYCLWAALLSLLLLCPLPAGAQVSASLSGRVTDPSGAAVSGATVTATDLGTGIVRTAVTDQSGMYQLLSLLIGRYELRAKKDLPRRYAPELSWWWARTQLPT